jgi:asparagine synthetase B (glutamine-hydrolysing)
MESVVPTFSPISDFLIAREVQRKGYSSCVYGHGPDELLNGYVRHAMLHWGQEHDPAKENFFDDVACPSYAPMAEHLWGTEESRNAGMLDQYTRMVLRSETSGDEQKARVAALFHRYEHPANSLSNCELNLCYPAQMLMGTSSALTWKISGFCPYLDPRVMSFCFQAPRLKYVGNRTKWLLREVGRRIGVPSSVTERVDKKGLVVPVTQWLLGPLASWTDDLVESLARRLPGDPNVTRKLARGQFDRQLYKLVSLELWYREFVDKE